MNWGVDFIGIGAVVLVFLACANVLILVMGIRRFRASEIAVCGNCQHAIHALDSGRCSECGLKYVQTGIQAGLVRPGFSTWIIAAIVLIVSGVFIYAGRSLSNKIVDEDLPLSLNSYMSSWARNLEKSQFENTENMFYVRLVFTQEKISVEDGFSKYYDWTPDPRQLELVSFEGEKISPLNHPLVLHKNIDESDVRTWLLEAGAIDESDSGNTRFEELVQQIVIDGNHFRNDESIDHVSGLQMNYATQGGVVERKAWISIVMDVAVFVLFGGIAFLLLVWTKFRSRRLCKARAS